LIVFLLLVLLFGYKRVAALIWYSLLAIVLLLGGLILFGSTLPDSPAPPAKVQAAPNDLISFPFDK